MKLKIVVTLFAIFLVQSSYAANEEPTCPLIFDVKAEQFTYAVKTSNDSWWAFIPRSSFETDKIWSFVIGPFHAMSNEEAIKYGNEYIKYLDPKATSSRKNDNSSYTCFYFKEIGGGTLMGGAQTPPKNLPIFPFSKAVN